MPCSYENRGLSSLTGTIRRLICRDPAGDGLGGFISCLLLHTHATMVHEACLGTRPGIPP